MSDVVGDIQEEIAAIEREMADQKRLIKRALDNPPVFEAAEAHLKELHGRLAVLKGNLRRLQ